MKKFLKSKVGLSIMMVTIVAAAYLACSGIIVKAARDTENDIQKLHVMGIFFGQNNNKPTIDEKVAINNAKEVFGGMVGESTGVSVEYQVIADGGDKESFIDAIKEAKPGILKADENELPAYIVTFKGVQIPSSYGHRYHQEFGVIVDARTGEVLQGYTYR